MEDVAYTKEHEWLKVGSDSITVGVTDHAQQQLGDVVYVELPDLETEFFAGDEAAVIESVKAAGEITIPFDGVVVEINETLVEQPDLLNTAPQTEGWMFRVVPKDKFDVSKFMNLEEYLAYVQDGEQ
ncbi:MAG: glycine cleavage system protein H [Porticoccaceae bacterium]|jgi:glycine cleavage system H protein|nr:glycine cleavage system protein H [Porticoccaceae bacterium]|tara:strand:- start:3279 stop:3659 length:381 start_codon:yes stop_codon:yes gene_type:complete